MNTKNTRIMLALIILFGAFVMFACDDDVNVAGEKVWDADSPAGKAVNGAGEMFDKAGDAVSDFTKDAAGNVLDTELHGNTSLCDGLKCK